MIFYKMRLNIVDVPILLISVKVLILNMDGCKTIFKQKEFGASNLICDVCILYKVESMLSLDKPVYFCGALLINVTLNLNFLFL